MRFHERVARSETLPPVSHSLYVRRRVIVTAIFFLSWAVMDPDIGMAGSVSSEQADPTMFAVPIRGYVQTCEENATIYTRSSSGHWEKATTELPSKGLYYLDDVFVGYGMCDVVVCADIPSFFVKLVTYEQIGEQAPPAHSGSTADSVPVYQALPLKGPIKIEVTYFSDSQCRHQKHFSTVIQR